MVGGACRIRGASRGDDGGEPVWGAACRARRDTSPPALCSGVGERGVDRRRIRGAEADDAFAACGVAPADVVRAEDAT